MEEKRPERTYSRLWQLATVLFVGMFLPVTVLLFMTPNSWYSAEGYEDLGVIEFVAAKVQVRGKGAYNHYVVYEALDGSGLNFREGKLSQLEANRVVQNKEHTRRHVYHVVEAPNFILSMTRNAGYHFLQEGKEPQSREELQSALDRARKTAVLGRRIGLCYSAGYVLVTLHRRAVNKREKAIAEG